MLFAWQTTTYNFALLLLITYTYLIINLVNTTNDTGIKYEYYNIPSNTVSEIDLCSFCRYFFALIFRNMDFTDKIVKKICIFQFLIYAVLYAFLALFFFGTAVLKLFKDEGIVEYR